MMKILVALLGGIIVLAALYFSVPSFRKLPLPVEDKYKGLKTINYTLENKKLKLLVADTPAKWEKGLMDYRKLDGVDGMIFIFPTKEPKAFWNKNTFMDLDLYWLDGDRVTEKSLLPSIEKSNEIIIIHSKEAVNKVIEIPHQ